MKPKLKPCPFCGGKDIYEAFAQECPYAERIPEIYCGTCKACFYIMVGDSVIYETKKNMTRKAWNRRTSDAEIH